MKKTCYNCRYFCGTLCDTEDPEFHVHDWCKYWQTFIPDYGIVNQYEYNGAYFTDLETGDAFCYMFVARETPRFEDAWFEKNKQENENNRIKKYDI